MVRHPSAVKRNRQNIKKKAGNRDIRSRMKTAVKSALKIIQEGNKEKAVESLKTASSIIAKTKSKGIIRKNTASRKISRLAKKVAALSAAG